MVIFPRLAATVFFISAVVAVPALAGHAKASGGGPVVAVATDYLHAKARDLKVMAVAVPYNAESANGSAAIVRVDDGSDGGNPVCHLLLLAGKPSSPGKVESSVKFTVCPRADQGKDTLLSRVQMGGKRYAWQLRLSTARYDAMAKGTEHSQHWALVAEMGTGPQVVLSGLPRLSKARAIRRPIRQKSVKRLLSKVNQNRNLLKSPAMSK